MIYEYILGDGITLLFSFNLVTLWSEYSFCLYFANKEVERLPDHCWSTWSKHQGSLAAAQTSCLSCICYTGDWTQGLSLPGEGRGLNSRFKLGEVVHCFWAMSSVLQHMFSWKAHLLWSIKIPVAIIGWTHMWKLGLMKWFHNELFNFKTFTSNFNFTLLVLLFPLIVTNHKIFKWECLSVFQGHQNVGNVSFTASAYHVDSLCLHCQCEGKQCGAGICKSVHINSETTDHIKEW